jgi:diaminopimelate decarboxylase
VEDRVPLRTDRQPVARVLDVAPDEDPTVLGKDRRAYGELRSRRVGTFGDGTRAFDQRLSSLRVQGHEPHIMPIQQPPRKRSLARRTPTRSNRRSAMEPRPDDADTSARTIALAALGHAGGPLRVGGVLATDLLEQFGSPLYAYDAAVLETQIAAVQSAFDGQTAVAFALKANPSLALAAVARRAGAGAEVASAGEILLAQSAGFEGGQIQFAGPGKSDEDLLTALSAGARIHLESEREFERLAVLARGHGTRPDVAVRVNLNASQSGARLRMADSSSRFGVDRARVPALCRRILDDGCCRLVGLHQYGGSQAFDAEAWVRSVADLLAVAAETEQATGHPLLSLNLGGGFGWPVYDRDPTFDLAAAGRGALELLDAAGRLGAPREIHLELGRYLAAPAGVFLTRVVDTKDSGGKRHAVLDGGMHQFGAATGLGAVMRRAYAILAVDAPDAHDGEPVTLGGPLCTPADRFGTGLTLPPLRPGDAIAVLHAGAYGLTFSPTRFLSHPSPAEVLVENGVPRLIRRRGSPADALRDQLP